MPATVPTCPSHLDRAAFASFYRDQGYAIARGVVHGRQLADLTRDFDRAVTQLREHDTWNARWAGPGTDKLDGGEATVIIHTHQIQSWSAAWGRFCYDETFLDVIESLIGEDVILHHSKLFEKPPGIGAPFPPHQDWSYFPCTGAAMHAAVVFLTPSDEHNGCIRVWPGSHRHGRIARELSKRGDGDFDQRFPMSESIPCIATAGDVVIFSDTTVHASLPNRGADPRKSVLFQVHSGRDEMEDGHGHPYAQLVLRGWNHRMRREKVR